MTMTKDTVPSPTDRAALGVTMVLGALAAGWTLVQAVLRIVEIVPNRDVPVTAAFADTPATLPIGPDGAAVEVVVERAEFLVSDMPPITLVSLILAEVVSALAIVGAVVCVILLTRNLMRGRAFGAQNVWLVGTGTVIVAIGWILSWLFETMGANGGTAALGSPGENSSLPLEIVPAFAVASLGALAVAFQIGHRLQRDAEGLI